MKPCLNFLEVFVDRLGRGFRVASFDGVVWSWRYSNFNARRFLYIYVDRQGVVSHWHTGDDLSRDRLPR